MHIPSAKGIRNWQQICDLLPACVRLPTLPGRRGLLPFSRTSAKYWSVIKKRRAEGKRQRAKAAGKRAEGRTSAHKIELMVLVAVGLALCFGVSSGKPAKSFAHWQTKGSICALCRALSRFGIYCQATKAEESVRSYLANAISHLSVCQLVQVHGGIGSHRNGPGTTCSRGWPAIATDSALLAVVVAVVGIVCRFIARKINKMKYLLGTTRRQRQRRGRGDGSTLSSTWLASVVGRAGAVSQAARAANPPGRATPCAGHAEASALVLRNYAIRSAAKEWKMVERHSKAQCHTVQVTVSLHSGPCVCSCVCAERARAHCAGQSAAVNCKATNSQGRHSTAG